MFSTLQDYSVSGMNDLLGACVDQCRDLVTSEGQANPKESREKYTELWESVRGTGQAEGYQRMAAK